VKKLTETQQIDLATKKECETRPAGSGERCRCPYPCQNFWLRRWGFGPPGREDLVKEVSPE
jgi:hypothetical protein